MFVWGYGKVGVGEQVLLPPQPRRGRARVCRGGHHRQCGLGRIGGTLENLLTVQGILMGLQAGEGDRVFFHAFLRLQ